MTRKNYLFTSESVSEGHPDKVCDRISDEIVDEFFRQGAKAGVDPYVIRVAAETLCTTNRVVIAGEVRGPHLAFEHIEDVARKAIKDIGYEQDGFHWKHAKVEVLLHEQSADIAQGVDAAGNKDEGAGDQGIMFGYAVRNDWLARNPCRNVKLPAPDGTRRLEDAAPILAVASPDGNEILIPFANAFILELDLPARAIRMALPEGLTQINHPTAPATDH